MKTEKVIFLTGGEGVDLNRFIPLKKEPEVNPRIVFLMISRPLYDKGYVEYVEAARQIKRTYKNVEFQLLGPIDTVYPRHIPEKQVWEDHESRTINYLGFVKNVIPIIKECDCIVLPSYNEGLSRSLMEAIAMGKPVITTNIPGCKETVEEGMNGYLVTPKSVESLVTAFNKFMNLTPRQRHMMGEYSREKAEREFDIKKVIEVYKSITDTLR